ncbi:helicase C-terminal domain-containing protein [Jiella pelagia]|uniref:DEAD/DEAH box helicase family protein n=1 Tax=Jiella pelagia TaxID=2986949 RepID=A0ABY7C3H9_9HYPH|nr:helicase C-terminal domain-containing protein [Jiella pelagia]WAP70362.1 DEAD/DEAH box helicase family protein [Jiella pelagia]
MAIKYGSGASGTVDTVTDPQKLFQALPSKAKQYAYLRDVQGDVLSKWYEKHRDKRDSVIKMNTGGGKTTVGLLLLKSSINAGYGPAVYVCPDYYLCSQVEKEAKALGLAYTSDPRSAEFRQSKSILIIPIFVLCNGMSKFGVGREVKLPIGSIVIDDAHACLADCEERFSIKVPRSDALYEELISLFQDDLKPQSPATFEEIRQNSQGGLIRVPYWAWKNKIGNVTRLLAAGLAEDPKKFAWPLFKDDIALCTAHFSTKFFEVTPRCLPIENIPSFDEAKRRIYMTATLAEDSILVTDFGADPESVIDSIVPKTASDIGERMILIPQSINYEITDEAIKRFIAEYSKTENVVIIVPSTKRALFWADIVPQDLILNADRIAGGVEKLRSKKGNIAVLLNKYDGIDLPGDACRLLVIDGLPDTRRLFDKYEEGTLRETARFQLNQVQKIEQGMGRGIRSNEDYCAVLLMGPHLLDVVYASGAKRFFSPATLAQMSLSDTVGEQLKGNDISALKEPIDDMLNRNPNWVSAAKNSLIEVAYPAQATVDAIAIGQRKAFVSARKGNFEAAYQALQAVADSADDKVVRGWVVEQAAEFLHHLDPERSQKTLSAAVDLNPRVTKPIVGIAYKRLQTLGLNQAQVASRYLSSRYPQGGNGVVLGLAGILDRLVFEEDSSEDFEQALMDLGLHLGFRSQRPEKEGSAKLDVMWGIGSMQYLLLPCKNEASTEAISKQYADEVSGNVNWFDANYDVSAKAVPVIVHPSFKVNSDAAPPANMRVLAKANLGELREAARKFGRAVKDNLGDADHIKSVLQTLNLTGEKIVAAYTSEFRKKPPK